MDGHEERNASQSEAVSSLTTDKLRRLKRSRGGHKSFVSKTRETLESIFYREETLSILDLKELEKNVQALRQSQNKIKEKDNQIEDEVPENDLESEIEETSEFHSELSSFIQKCQSLIEKQEKASDANDAVATTTHVRNGRSGAGSIKLPKIELPSFSGKYTEWTSFYDLFNASVHSNNSLKPAEKLNYLKTALKGEAFTLVKNLTITDTNYENARNILEQRYANKRFIVRMHLDEIFNQGVIKCENGNGLRKLLEAFHENVAALKAQGCNCNDWDPILLHVLAGKLDIETRKQWELQQSGTELQKLPDLLKFIDTRARALETIEKNSTKGQEKPNFCDQNSATGSVSDWKFQSYATQLESRKCTVRPTDQSVAKTDEFKTMTPLQRKQFVQSKNLCFNCLRPGHAVANCPSKFSCRHCSTKHHSLLHIDVANQPKRFEKAKVSTTDNPKPKQL